MLTVPQDTQDADGTPDPNGLPVNDGYALVSYNDYGGASGGTGSLHFTLYDPRNGGAKTVSFTEPAGGTTVDQVSNTESSGAVGVTPYGSVPIGFAADGVAVFATVAPTGTSVLLGAWPAANHS